VRITVVGCSPAWPNPGVAHSGYVIEGAGLEASPAKPATPGRQTGTPSAPRGRLLLDCGPGILAKLREREGGWPQLESIVISHWHLDHWGDLVPWVWGRMFGLGHESDPPEVWVPPGGVDQLEMFGELFGTPSMFANMFPLREYVEREPFETAAGLTLSAFQVPHYLIDTYAFRVTDGERTLAYSGDSAPSEALVEAARGADLFLCEATLVSGDADNDPRGHMSADEAVAAFEASGAGRLVLTHRPQELPIGDGIELAQEGLVLEL
jgi:ribonuclease BN (tRNA processing enzyme)